MSVGRRAAGLLVLLAVGAPALAHACPVCFDPRDANRAAFLATTVFMSLLPLAMVAAVAAWLAHRARSRPHPHSGGDTAVPDAVLPGPGARGAEASR